MKIVSCTVLFNPDNEVVENILSYAKYVDEVLLIDNSKNKNDVLYKILYERNINYKLIFFGENLGIAQALKSACEYAINGKYDWCLTMDQDSSIEISKNDFYKIKELLRLHDNYGIISFDYNNSINSDLEINDVKTWITSGNFINIEKYKSISGFNEKLFIDYVDFDICRQFHEKGTPVGVMKYSIKHQIGNPITIKIFNKSFNCMNHSPIRYYYRYRNSRYLYKKNKFFYLKIYLHEMIIDFLKMIIFESNKKEKTRMIYLGLKDANNQLLGPYNKR